MRRKTILPDESLRESIAGSSADLIYRTIVNESGIDPKLIKSKTKKQDVVIVRHLVHYFLSVNEDRSYSQIGKLFHKDHGTVISSRRVVENLMSYDHEFKLRVIILAVKIMHNYNRKKIQLIGKVKDLSRTHAVEKFIQSKIQLEAQGWEVWNPMEHVPTNVARGEEMRICLRNLVDPGTVAVAVQPDWVSSEGSKVEYMVANALNLQILKL